MANLYKDLAPIYEAMYQTFIDYDAEYAFYSEIMKRYNKKSILEIGSGTGNLARQFVANKFDYQGLDYSEEMIAIAKSKLPECEFIQADMRDFSLEKAVESIFITGRTISYLVKNENVNNTFSSIYNNLQTNGILCFDFIDARAFIPALAKGKKIRHEASFQGKHYFRESFWQMNLEHGMDFKWDSIYYEQKGKEALEIGQDNSIVRAFTADEIAIFLAINQFELKEMIPRAAYAFPTYVAVAEKI